MWNWLNKMLNKLGINSTDDTSSSNDGNSTTSYQAKLTPLSPEFTVRRFVDLGPTPGNVGICLSGGGSRALTAGMGQLRALKFLTTPDGKSLLGQARALSTVSGGSWLGVTFQYLTAGTSDDDFLNRYVPDPGRLVLSQTAGHSQAETLDQLPPGNIATAVASRHFGPVQLTLQVLLLHKFGRVPGPFLWQTAIGLHLLRPYGLYQPGEHFAPRSLFSYDGETMSRDVTGPNPGLSSATAYLIAAGPDRVRRPFLVCNAAMFVDQPDAHFELLAPFQATPFMTGILGTPSGVDANGNAPGGGGVTSFAFNSDPQAVNGDQVSVAQNRPLALMDIVGTSSAFFAETLQNTLASWRDNTDKSIDEIQDALGDVLDWVEKVLPSKVQQAISQLIDRERLQRMKSNGVERKLFGTALKSLLGGLKDLIPEYTYWPVTGAAPAQNLKPTRFADGGNLENTGIASLLAYQDIDNVITFINSSTPLTAGAKGVIDAQGNEIPGTRVVIAGQVPGLFGYQPHDPQRGYVLYAGATKPTKPEFQHNQVFPATAFPELLRGLWAATGNAGAPAATQAGVNQHPAVLKTTLPVLANPWFGVQGGRTVGVLWCLTNRVRDWHDQLSPAVQQTLGAFDDPSSLDHFPHYSTVKTHLTTTQINLLANLTAWSVANPKNQQLFIDMFTPGN